MVGMKDHAFGDTPVYPESPGYKAQVTAKAAADSVAASAPELRARVLAALKEKPQTSDEVAAALGVSILSIRPRCSELLADAKIAPAGIYRKNESGRNAIVWKAVVS